MNARAILQRLREEQKVVREETATTEETDEKETTTATSRSRRRNHNTSIPTKRYEDAVLTERRVQIATTTTRQSRGAETVDTRDESSSLTIHLLEDPTGSWAGGNGATLWDCALALTEVLVPRYTSSSSTTSSSMLEPPPSATTLPPDPLHILELGAGLGLCGIALAACGNSSPGRRRRPHHVLVTERAIAVPLLQRNVENYTTKHTATPTRMGGNNTNNNVVRVAELKWGRKATQDLVCTERRHRRKTTTCAPSPVFDVIIMSDLIFPSNSDNYSLLVDTLVVLLLDNNDNNNDNNDDDTIDCGIRTTTTTSSSIRKSQDTNRRRTARTVDVYLSYEPRQPEIEATFWTLLRTAGIYAQRIPNSKLPKKHPEDIYIYTLSTTEEETFGTTTNRVGDAYGRA